MVIVGRFVLDGALKRSARSDRYEVSACISQQNPEELSAPASAPCSYNVEQFVTHRSDRLVDVLDILILVAGIPLLLLNQFTVVVENSGN